MSYDGQRQSNKIMKSGLTKKNKTKQKPKNLDNLVSLSL